MELKGTGFTLREFKPDDAPSLQKYADNPNVYSFLTDRFPHPYTMDDANNWIAITLGQSPVVHFAIAVDNEVTGGISLEMRGDVHSKAPLLGYWLGEQFWGKSIMTEAVKLMTNYAFSNFDIVRIQAEVLGNNPASARVLEKAGFVREGFLRNNIIKSGVVMDELIYGMLK